MNSRFRLFQSSRRVPCRDVEENFRFSSSSCLIGFSPYEAANFADEGRHEEWKFSDSGLSFDPRETLKIKASVEFYLFL
jgi:hypothetical protein